MKLSLGPVLYFWAREPLLEFYRRMTALPFDAVYLGETVCSKRRALSAAEWIELGRHLARGGKQVVLSTLALIEAESELATLARLCGNGELLVEANDMAGVRLLMERRLPFVAGPALNVYNTETLSYLVQRGLKRWVPPVDLTGTSLAAILRESADSGLAERFEIEVFGFGRMPLAYSARCFTARFHNRPKDDCGFLCRNYPDGLPLSTQENAPFLTLNGIQVQSGKVLNLLPVWRELQALGVGWLRLSPQSQHMEGIVNRIHRALHAAEESPPDLSAYVDAPFCDGYWHAAPGMEQRSALTYNL